MAKIKREFMTQKQARTALAKIFKNGVFSGCFKEVKQGNTTGRLEGSFIILESNVYSVDKLNYIIDKQITLK